MTRRKFAYPLYCLFFIVVFGQNGVFAESKWYKCTAYGSSHTGRYTFRINPQTCAVYWKEIDTHLKIKKCALPVISALKPSARDEFSVVWFNLKTGRFYDNVSGVFDRGKCVVD